MKTIEIVKRHIDLKQAEAKRTVLSSVMDASQNAFLPLVQKANESLRLGLTEKQQHIMANQIENEELTVALAELSGWQKEVGILLLAEAVATEVEERESQYHEYMRDFIRSQEDIVELVQLAAQSKGIDIEKFLPVDTVKELEKKWDVWAKGKLSLDDLWYHSEKAVFHYAMEALGHGVGVADDEDDVEYLAEHGLDARDVPSSFIESAYDEAWQFLEAYDAVVKSDVESSVVASQDCQPVSYKPELLKKWLMSELDGRSVYIQVANKVLDALDAGVPLKVGVQDLDDQWAIVCVELNQNFQTLTKKKMRLKDINGVLNGEFKEKISVKAQEQSVPEVIHHTNSSIKTFQEDIQNRLVKLNEGLNLVNEKENPAFYQDLKKRIKELEELKDWAEKSQKEDVHSSFNDKDMLIGGISFEELIITLEANVPAADIDASVVKETFDNILQKQVDDARHVLDTEMAGILKRVGASIVSSADESLKEKAKKFRDLQEKFEHFGATDSESEHYLASLMKKAAAGKDAPVIKSSGWQLYSDMASSDKAADQLTELAYELYEAVKAASDEEIEEVFSYYGW